MSLPAGGLGGLPDLANTGDGFTVKGRTEGHCILSNVEVGRQLYNGNCTIKEKIDGNSTKFTIKMGSSEPFMFATSDGSTWMHGPNRVKIRDHVSWGVFKWDNFRLEVHEDYRVPGLVFSRAFLRISYYSEMHRDYLAVPVTILSESVSIHAERDRNCVTKRYPRT